MYNACFLCFRNKKISTESAIRIKQKDDELNQSFHGGLPKGTDIIEYLQKEELKKDVNENNCFSLFDIFCCKKIKR